LQTLFTNVDLRNEFRTIHLLILDQYISRWGQSDIFGGLPLTHVSRRLWCCNALLRVAAICTETIRLKYVN